MRRARHGAATAAALALLLAGCGADPAPVPTARATRNGVTVTVALLPAADGAHRIRATFRPEPGFHVYSIDLPEGGVDGLGVATRLSVGGDLTATGEPTADRAVVLLRPAGLEAALPVYPDGEVTFTLPVRRTGSRGADVIVSYGACGASRCLVPVTDERIPLPGPG